jgi:hypothetical protein
LRPHEGAHLFDFPEVDELPPQKLGIKEVDEGIWLVSFMHYDLGYTRYHNPRNPVRWGTSLVPERYHRARKIVGNRSLA